jgi:hypothetical protein
LALEQLRESGARAATRLAGAAVLCLLAIPFSFIGTLFLGLVPLGLAVWLIATSPWPGPARVAVSVAFVAATIGLFALLLSQLTFN